MIDAPMLDTYQEYYKRIQTSSVFPDYCSRVFDIDLSQDGFCNKSQIDMMINKMNISQNDSCLDIGCGNGKIANYIVSKTKCDISGIDYSENAINNAKYLFPKIKFYIQDINNIDIQNNKYNKVYLIDSIYFSNNYEKTIMDLYNGLLDDGEIGIFYSEMMFEKEKQRILKAEESEVGKVIIKNKLCYHATDITSELFSTVKLKRLVGLELQQKFEIEGNTFLFDRINTESIDSNMPYEDFVKFSPRFFYRIKKSKKI